MPHLRSLKVTDIDPLCYPDDISTLLLHSKKLRELKMHWSPRMREAQEPSVTLHDYFRKCIAAKSPLRIRKIALQNFYALHTDDFETAMDPAYLEDITTLNSPGVYDASVPATSFVDNSWPAPNKLCHNIKSLRHDRIERKGCEFLACLNNLERLYFVTPVRDPTDSINSPRTAEQSHSSASLTPPSRTEPNGANTNGVFTNNSAQMPAASPMSLASHIALRDAHINTITTVHGPKLRHLLLPSRWALPAPMIARLVHSCPNLEQLALATDLSSFDTLGLLIPFLRKLAAIRLLIPTGPASTTTALSKPHTNGITANGTVTQKVSPLDAQSLSEIVEMDDRIFNEAMGSRLADKELFSKLKIIGLGWKAWELGEFYTIPVTEKTSVYEFNSSPDLAMLNNGTSSITRKNTEPVSAGPSNSRAAPILSPHISPVSRSRGPRPSTSHAAIDCNTPKSVLGKRKEPPSSGSAPSTTLLPPTSYSTPTPSHNPIITPSSHAPANGLSAPAPHSTASVLEKLGPQLWLSEETRAKLTSCLPEPPRIGESVLFRRKVRRVGWDVVKNWEIWGLDVQEI